MLKITRSEIRPSKGAPTLFIKGKPHSSFSYMTYHPVQKYFEQFAQEGIDLYSFAANADSLDFWGMAPTWIDEDNFDYATYEDKMYEMINEAAPGSYIFPRVHTIGPRWWVDKHPEECVQYIDEKGKRRHYEWEKTGLRFPSLASKKGVALCCEAVERYMTHVLNAPYAKSVMGCMVCGWVVGEWMSDVIDCSNPMRDRFRTFLEKKYRKVDKLRKAWGDADVRFDNIEVPNQHVLKPAASQTFFNLPEQQRYADYWENYSDVVSDALLGLAKAAKEACDYKQVVGAFYGYVLQFGAMGNQHGHLALRKVLESPYIDFLSSPSCYHRRDLRNGHSYFMTVPETVKLHGKMWWDENDYRTYLSTLKQLTGRDYITADELDAMTEKQRNTFYEKNKPYRIVGANESLEESIAYQVRESANCVSDGAGMWWFDMGGGWFDQPDFMKAVGKMNAVAAKSVSVDRSEIAEIGVVFDAWSTPNSPTNSQAHWQAVLNQVPALGRIGAPVARYLLEDLDKAPDHKFWIFLNAFAPTSKERKCIQEKVLRDGNTVLWLHAPGLLNKGKVSVRAASQLTGFKLKLDVNPAPLCVSITEAAHPITEGYFEMTYGAGNTLANVAAVRDWRGKLPWDADLPTDWKQNYTGITAGPIIYVDDDEATALGYLTGVPRVGFAFKRMENWNSVFSTAAPMSPGLLRNLARFAGCHIYTDNDEELYANKSFLTVVSNHGGRRTINLPRKTDVVDVMTGKVIARGVNEFTVDIPPATCKWFYTGPAKRWK